MWEHYSAFNLGRFSKSKGGGGQTRYRSNHKLFHINMIPIGLYLPSPKTQQIFTSVHRRLTFLLFEKWINIKMSIKMCKYKWYDDL